MYLLTAARLPEETGLVDDVTEEDGTGDGAEETGDDGLETQRQGPLLGVHRPTQTREYINIE